MAVDVDSFTDNNIINGTLSHTVTVTPATVIDSVSYRVENSTLSNEVSVDDVDYTVDDTETGINVTLKPHILRHERASTGSADIVITITDKYGRSVNVTDSVSIMTITTRGLPTSANFRNINVADTAGDLNTTDFNLVLSMNITPTGSTGGATTNILNKFKGPAIGTSSNIVKAEFINDGEFVVTTSQPSQKVPTMTEDGALYVMTASSSSTFVSVPIARLTNYLPTSWNEASIFDNMIDSNVFKYKLNDSYLKLYTYNDGWDDRDYIIFEPISTANVTIQTDYQTTGPDSSVTTADLVGAGLKGALYDSTMMTGTAANYIGGRVIPRIAGTTFKVYNPTTRQSTTYNDSDYGVTFSSSNTNSSDTTVTDAVYMYTGSLTRIATTDNRLEKDRSWLLVTAPQLNDNTGKSNSRYIGLSVTGTANYTQS